MRARAHVNVGALSVWTEYKNKYFVVITLRLSTPKNEPTVVDRKQGNKPQHVELEWLYSGPGGLSYGCSHSPDERKQKMER